MLRAPLRSATKPLKALLESSPVVGGAVPEGPLSPEIPLREPHATRIRAPQVRRHWLTTTSLIPDWGFSHGHLATANATFFAALAGLSRHRQSCGSVPCGRDCRPLPRRSVAGPLEPLSAPPLSPLECLGLALQATTRLERCARLPLPNCVGRHLADRAVHRGVRSTRFRASRRDHSRVSHLGSAVLCHDQRIRSYS